MGKGQKVIEIFGRGEGPTHTHTTVPVTHRCTGSDAFDQPRGVSSKWTVHAGANQLHFYGAQKPK